MSFLPERGGVGKYDDDDDADIYLAIIIHTQSYAFKYSYNNNNNNDNNNMVSQSWLIVFLRMYKIFEKLQSLWRIQ